MRTNSRRTTIALGTVLIVGVVAACGTTVRTPPGGGQQANGLAAPTGAFTTGASNGQPGSGVPGAGTSGALPTGSLTGGALPTGSLTGGSTRSTTGAAGNSGGGTTSAGSGTTALSITNGPGKLSPVEIGIGYVSDEDAFDALVGSKTKVGNQLVEAQAAINWVNAHGGLGGHPLVPVFSKQSVLGTAPYSTLMSSICTAWTQDHHVAAGMVVSAAATDQLPQCMNSAGDVYISGSTYLHDQASYAAIPKLFSPIEATSDSAIGALVNYLLATKKITSKDKVGVLLADNESAAVRTYNNVVVPKLKAAGVNVASYEVQFPSSTLDAANSLKEVTNDQLHMRSDGVTMVLTSLAPGGAATFMKDAANQGWKPKYGLTSIDAPIQVAKTNSNVDAQLANATAIGWEPGVDVGTFGNSNFVNSETSLCQSIEGPTGQITDYTSQVTSFEWCDTLLTLQAAVNAEGTVSTVTGNSVAAGYDKLGNHTSAIVASESVSSSHHAGANAYRVMTFGTSCACFTYSGSPVQF